MLIDTHAHLYWEDFQPDFQDVLKNCQDAKVTTLINVGVDLETSLKVQSLDCSPLKSYTTIGLHPHEAVKYHQDPTQINKDIQELEKIYEQHSDKIVAIGECGLDYLFSSNDLHSINLPPEKIKELQQKLFTSQIELAKKLDLPLTVHCRDDRSQSPDNIECWNETLDLIKDHKGVLHCYSGLPEITQKALNLNFYISFAANVTYPKNEYLREAIKQIPLDRIVLETDCPFLSPQISRGGRNEPKNVLEVAKCIAEIKGISIDEVSAQTTENAKRIFNI